MRQLRIVWAGLSFLVVLLLSSVTVLGYFFVSERFTGVRLGGGWYDALEVLSAISPVPFAAVGALVLLRRPANRISLLLSLSAIVLAVNGFSREYTYFVLVEHGYLLVLGRTFAPSAGDVAFWISVWTEAVAIGSLTVLLFFIFPDGKLPSRNWRPAAAFGTAVFAALCLRSAFGPTSHPRLRRFEIAELDVLAYGVSVLGRKFEIVQVLLIVSIGVGAISLLLRYRRSDEEGRLQLKWFALAAAAVAATNLAIPALHFAGMLTHPLQIGLGISDLVFRILLPIAIGVAILKHRLFDIDFVLNKAFALGVLSLFITGAYVAITVAAGTVIGSTGPADTVSSVVALGFVAIGFEPIRHTTQRWADRLVYGERAEPYEILAGFSHNLPSSLHVERALPAIAEAIASGLRAEAVRVHLYLADGKEHVVTRPAPLPISTGEPDLSVPIAFRGNPIGLLEVVKRRSESVKREDWRLVRLLASQAGAALNNVRLTMELEDRRKALVTSSAQLRASRRRLVGAQLEVRQALERELRTRVAPHIHPVRELATHAEEIASADPRRAIEVLEVAAAGVDRGLGELRDIAHGIFSPLVSERGIVTALESQIRKVRAQVDVRAVGDVRTKRFEGSVESTVYSCCIETITAARTALDVVLVEQEGDLEFRVSGPSFDPIADLGQVRRQNLADRLEAVGGTLDITYASGSKGVVIGRLPASPVTARGTSR